MQNDHELIAELIGPSRELALAELIRRYGRMVERSARRLLENSHAAEDVSQAVFLALVRKAPGLRREGSIAGWLHQVTVLTARDALKMERRRKRREREAHLMSTEPSETIEMPAGFDEALERLPKIYRTAIELRYLEGRTANEIADALGMKPSTLDMRITRGLRWLRNALAPAASGLSIATLAQMLEAEATAASSTSSKVTASAIFHLNTVAAASQPAALLSKGALKTMFWIKMKFAAAALCASLGVLGGGYAVIVSAEEGKHPNDNKPKAEAKRAGPLADLPSPPGPHLAKIKNLKDGEWCDLGAPAPDPKWGNACGRAWCSRASFAPDLNGAFIVGQGPHGMVKKDGHFLDDIWFYDLNAHKWICCYGGTSPQEYEQKGKSGEWKLNDIGQLVDKAGDVIPSMAICGHSYMWHTYDTDRHQYVTCGWFGQGPLPGFDGGGYGSFPWAGPFQHTTPGKEKDLVEGSPMFFDTGSGKFQRYAVDDNAVRFSFSHALNYVPSKKMLIALFNGGADGSPGTAFLYDPEKHHGWTATQTSGATIGTYDSVCCYDSKRDRIWMKDHYYDVKTNTWSAVAAKGEGPTASDSNEACLTYDSVNDRLVHLVFSNANDQQRIKPALHIFDPETSTWTSAATPINASCVNGFYSPQVNAHIYYYARDGFDTGTIFAYRYKNAK